MVVDLNCENCFEDSGGMYKTPSKKKKERGFGNKAYYVLGILLAVFLTGEFICNKKSNNLENKIQKEPVTISTHAYVSKNVVDYNNRLQ